MGLRWRSLRDLGTSSPHPCFQLSLFMHPMLRLALSMLRRAKDAKSKPAMVTRSCNGVATEGWGRACGCFAEVNMCREFCRGTAGCVLLSSASRCIAKALRRYDLKRRCCFGKVSASSKVFAALVCFDVGHKLWGSPHAKIKSQLLSCAPEKLYRENP